MKVICRNAGYLKKFLTVDKEYVVYGEDTFCFLIKNDRGEIMFHPKVHFEEVN